MKKDWISKNEWVGKYESMHRLAWMLGIISLIEAVIIIGLLR